MSIKVQGYVQQKTNISPGKLNKCFEVAQLYYMRAERSLVILKQYNVILSHNKVCIAVAVV